MAIEHVLRDFDTIQSLAAQYGVTWQEIVDYNSLEYPYILDSKEAYNKLYASGYVKVTRTLSNSPLTFYKGSQFSTKIDSQGIRKVYELTEDTTIPAGEPTGYLPVRCTIYGTFGNTIEDTIIEAYSLNTSLGSYVSSLTVTNEEAFTNGVDATVRITGQTVYIPTSEDEENDMVAVNDADTFLNMLGGEDFLLAEDGDMVDDGFGDIGTAIGAGNIKQSVKNRLMTERGSLPHHPEYGTRLHQLIGMAQTPYAEKLMELDIEDSLSYDDRITAVTVNYLEVRGTAIIVDLTLEINKQGENFTLELDFQQSSILS